MSANNYIGSLRYEVPDEPVGEVPNMDLFPIVRERETWVDAEARIWGDSPFMCEDVLRQLMNNELHVALMHLDALPLDQAMDAIRAMMGTKRG